MADVQGELIKSIVGKFAADADVQKLAELMAGQPIVLESKTGQQAINLDWLTNIFSGLFSSPFLKKLLPLVGPLITAIATGGLSMGTLLPLLFKVIAQLLGISESTAKAMVLQSLQAQENSTAPEGGS